jgi:hypothetical protein
MSRASSSSKEGNLDSVVRPLVILVVEAMDPDVGNEGSFGDETFDVLGDGVGEIALGWEDVVDR